MDLDVQLLALCKAPVGVEVRSEHCHLVPCLLQTQGNVDYQVFSASDSQVGVDDGNTLVFRTHFTLIII